MTAFNDLIPLRDVPQEDEPTEEEIKFAFGELVVSQPEGWDFERNGSLHIAIGRRSVLVRAKRAVVEGFEYEMVLSQKGTLLGYRMIGMKVETSFLRHW